MWTSLLLSLTVLAWDDPAATPSVAAEAAPVTAEIDLLVQRHWQAKGITPGPLADDATFLRRVTLDLAGRIPTASEATEFVADSSSDKRQRAIDRLLASPEFHLHLGTLLDDVIQGKLAGDREFIAYLRAALAEGKSWDRLFQEMLVGPWDAPERQVATRFLSRRLNSLDDLTNDTARVFFGVDISCAKCHDHPLVDDWKQHHYYGLASFFSRTQEVRDRKPPFVGEKDTGDVVFIDTSGAQHNARMMFLAGQTVDDPRVGLDPRLQDRRQAAAEQGRYIPASFSPREELVRLALEDRRFLSHALANRMWAWLMGRGLVHPVEQMHSGNPSSIPGLLDWLGDDLAASGYRIDRLAAGIVGSRAYQLSSEWDSLAAAPDPEHFARAAVRPLTRLQFAVAVVQATGEESYDQAADEAGRTARYQDWENNAYGLIEPLDHRRDGFQSSAAEALFMSNAPRIQGRALASGNNLAARLAVVESTDELLDKAFQTVLSRMPDDEERGELKSWLERPGSDRRADCGSLVWALVTSAEFRFNH
jgi:hypothetical protein